MSYDTQRIQALLAECDDRGATNAVRGRALETLVAELFGAIPGVTVAARNSVDVFESQEIDVGVSNDAVPGGLEGFERLIFVECKNWNKPVGSLEVAWLDTKLRLRGVDFGVLVALRSITGKSHALTSAQFILASALPFKRFIVVLTRADIQALRQPKDLVALLQEKRLRLVMSGGAL